MSQEAVPDPDQPCQSDQPGRLDLGTAHDATAPAQRGAPKGLLQQMDELMEALNADLSRLGADLRQSPPPGAAAGAGQQGDDEPGHS
ncbi:hypothetical protein [Streptomyces sp. NPDC029674]|uniref:hypothetical protein n=1 Tax=Streptomyces sp. NPDC029674 TaxID=3365297 RepID=UPI00384B1341